MDVASVSRIKFAKLLTQAQQRRWHGRAVLWIHLYPRRMKYQKGTNLGLPELMSNPDYAEKGDRSTMGVLRGGTNTREHV
ncbi:MAG: hypothetical protein CSA33_03145 [Desulfobulbus propionicus]|nr:MAG: hypothetical protein CSA33_03145 [Desulfobulbus propionicus]